MSSYTGKILTFLISALCLTNGYAQAQNSSFELSNNDKALRYRKADNIHRYMNLSIDPCVDFYQFTCGAWSKHHPAGRGFYETSPVEMLYVQLDQELIPLLNSFNNNETNTDRKLKNFFHSCMNLPLLNPSGYSNKMREIIHEFEAMPLLQGPSWKGFRFGWIDAVGKIYKKYGIEILLSYFYDTEKRVVLTHPDLLMGQYSYYLNANMDVYRKSYVESISWTMVNFLGVDHFAAEHAALEFFEFETILAKAIAQNSKPVLTSAYALIEKYNHKLPIMPYFLGTIGAVPTGNIVEMDGAYNAELTNVIKSTPEHVLANYIFYALIQPFIKTLPAAEMERAYKCMAITKSHFPDFVDNLLYRQYDVKQTEHSVLNLFHDLKNIFKSHLNSPKYYWLHRSTREKAISKLNSMKISFKSYAEVNFDVKYDSMIINNTDYVENLKSIFKNKATSNLRIQGQIPDEHVDTVVYKSHANMIQVSIAMLKPHYFWSSSFPANINFGGLGFMLAREIVHAVDGSSIHFDDKGRATDWFDARSRKHFDERVGCLKNQLQHYIAHLRPLPQLESHAETIDDAGGMRLLYDVYSSWLKNPFRPKQASFNPELLPPLTFSPEQLFFISYGQIWCDDILPAYRKLKVDDYLPNYIRVRATLSNLNEFATAFKCPRGSVMNPEKKCEIF